jgi:glycine dehydrogenase subunit 1
MFEYQTLICQLTGMDVSNASLYDGGSALTEAALMSLSVSRGRQKVIVAESVHPEYRQILATYLRNRDSELVTVACPDGIAHATSLSARVDGETACVIVQHPNFFGCPENLPQIASLAHDHQASLIVSVDPISLGVLRRPGDDGADIVVAEGQSLGNPMSYGGPYLGIMACRERFVRRMPGRIAGQTVDRHGRTCWVLTMQTREQHIRREKATSNICTNQGLFALRASIYLSLLGPQGLREVATLSMQKAHYAAEQITAVDRFTLAWSQPFFKEFVIRTKQNEVANLLEEAQRSGILAGVPLGTWYPDLEDCFLIAVTEQRTRSQIDQLTACLAAAETTETLSHA